MSAILTCHIMRLLPHNWIRIYRWSKTSFRTCTALRGHPTSCVSTPRAQTAKPEAINLSLRRDKTASDVIRYNGKWCQANFTPLHLQQLFVDACACASELRNFTKDWWHTESLDVVRSCGRYPLLSSDVRQCCHLRFYFFFVQMGRIVYTSK